MNKIIFFLASLLAGISAYAQNDMLFLEGHIDTYPVKMIMRPSTVTYEEGEKETMYSGSYYYDKTLQPIDFYQVKSDRGTLKLEAFSSGEQNAEFFEGHFDGKTYTGHWSKENKQMPFSLEVRTPPVSFREYSEEEEVRHPEITDQSGTAILSFYLPTPAPLMNIVMSQLNTGRVMPISAYMNVKKSEFTDVFMSSADDYLKSVAEGDSFYMNLSYSYFQGVFPKIITKNLLVLELSEYQYSGGAHGYGFSRYINIDLATGKQITLKDVLQLQHREEIEKVLDKIVRKKHNIPAGVPLIEGDDSPFLVDTITLSEDFYIVKDGIVLEYDTYELTPYVYGPYTLFVPKSEIQKYLNPSFRFPVD